MTKFEDNQSPYLTYIEQGSTPSNPSAGDQKLFIDSADHKLKRVNSSGTVTIVESAGGGGGLLAVAIYAPASLQIYSITGTSMADVDATNLKVTFTAPASGNVLVRLNAYADETVAAETYWGLRESSSDIAGSIGRIYRAIADEGYFSYAMYVTGVSGGSHTYKWSAAVSAGGTARIIIQDGSAVAKWGAGIMEVWAAP